MGISFYDTDQLNSRPRRPAVLCRTVLLALVTSALVVAGCTGSILGFDDPENTRDARDAPVTSIPVEDVPAVSLDDPHSQWSFAADDTVALSHDGRRVALVERTSSGFEIEVVDESGSTVWEDTAVLTSADSADVSFFADGLLAVSGYRQTEDGLAGAAVLYGGEGDVLWETDLTGPARLEISPAAGKVAVVHRREAALSVHDIGGGVLYEEDITGRTDLRFVGGEGRLVVADEEEIRLFAPGGSVERSYPVGRNLRQRMALTDDLTRIAVVTTVTDDNTLYMFDVTGGQSRALWTLTLYPGGGNGLLFYQEAERLLVYDVGHRAGIYSLDADTGRIDWAPVFEGDGALAVEQVVAHPDGHLVALLREEAEDPPRSHLLVFAADGEPLSRWSLPQGHTATLADDGSVLLVQGAAADADGDQQREHALYRLDALLQED